MSATLIQKREMFDAQCKQIKLESKSGVKKMRRVTCPCCGYPTLDERGTYDICELCNWEDDGQDDDDSAVCQGGPNGGYSLDQARENFLKYRIMYSPENNTTLTRGDSAEQLKIKIELIALFDRLLSEGNIGIAELWRQILTTERALYQEVKRQIQAYGKTLKP